jgi:TetR/AcrR family transcriptional regulator, cholesterol catabolism regulator
MPLAATDPDRAPRRPRGRPRKTAADIDAGNRRRELLRAAARLFRDRGFAATSTRDIAAAVGMRSGSPFYHFKSKGALLYAVMEEGMRSALLRQQCALDDAPANAPEGGPEGEEGATGVALDAAPAGSTVAAAAPTAEARLARLVRAHFDILLGRGSDFVPVMLYEWRSLNTRQRAAIAQLQREYDARWLPVLDALAAAGRLRGDPHLARLFMLGALNWSVQWYDPKKRATLDDLTQAALELFLQA